MLSSKYKISSSEFNIFLKNGIKKKSKHFNVIILYSGDVCYSKYSVIISKKLVKTAVLRNKNKRKIYKILNKLYPQFLHIKYIFIFIKRNIISVSEEKITKELIDILEKK